MFEKLAYPRSARHSGLLVGLTWLVYLALFIGLHDRIGLGISTLAIFPIIGCGWYFGTLAGFLMAVFTLVFDLLVLTLPGHTPREMLNAGGILGGFDLLLIGFMMGRLGDEARRRRGMLAELRGLELEQRNHTDFLSALNQIIQAALAADHLEPFFEFLVESMGKLFAADGCLFALWDEAGQVPVPKSAYGPARRSYPQTRYELGEANLVRAILESNQPLTITDFQNSRQRQMMNPKAAAWFEGAGSVLLLPLAAQGHKLGLMSLSFNRRREFSRQDIEQAELAAHQMALILTRIRLFEESQRRIKELAVLHEIALASTQVEGEDQLLGRVVEIINQNLFPDNFGILLLDESTGLLRAHPSYRFHSSDGGLRPVDVRLGEGISGQVAQSGKAQRIGDVRVIPGYLNVDAQTRSEVCVPVIYMGKVLGVINAESTQLNSFTPDDEDLMVTMAGQLAIALEHLRSREAEHHWMAQMAHTNELAYSLSHVTAEIEKGFSAAEVIACLEVELKKMGLKCLPGFYVRETGQVIFHFTPLLPAGWRDANPEIKENLLNYELAVEKLETLFGIDNVLALKILPDPVRTIRTILTSLPEQTAEKIVRDLGLTSGTEIIHLPLMFEDRLLGMIWIWGRDLTGKDLPVISIFAKQIAIALEKARLFQEVQNLALTDPLTGLYNRRGLFELGRVEFARSLRAGRPFSGIMVDLDLFKNINDEHGHSTGDRVLQIFADRCRKSVREVDFVGRYGGEEVIILLPETDLEESIAVAERLRKNISNVPMQITDQLQLNVTASLGVARQDEHTPNLETLIARADQAMYIAKHKGRNQVAISV